MEIDKNGSRQKQFLDLLADTIPSNASLPAELADVLEISMDSAYRRIRGETALNIDELVKLCAHFNISFDSFSGIKSNNVSFEYSLINSKEMFGQYLMALIGNLEAILQADQKEMVYACEDIPVFINYNFPPLARFKIFYWLVLPRI